MNAAWPDAGHTALDGASPDAPRCSLRWTSMGDAAGEDEDAGNWKPRAAAIAAMATSRPAARILRFRRVVVRAAWRWLMPPFKAAGRGRRGWGFPIPRGMAPPW